MSKNNKQNFERFLAGHPVFSLEEWALARGETDSMAAAHNQLKYHLRRGRIKRLARSLFAAVPWDQTPERFQPDPVVVAACVQPDGIFSHHTALELLGASHSFWQVYTLFCTHPPAAWTLDQQTIQFLAHPTRLKRNHQIELGIRQTERQGRWLKYTGPERTLIDGLRQPRWVGGVDELIVSAAGFGVLKLGLVAHLLTAYGQYTLWAAMGWFLERYQERFYVPDAFLADLEQHRPSSPRYLIRSQQGGRLCPRWNLIVPHRLLAWEGQDEQP